MVTFQSPTNDSLYVNTPSRPGRLSFKDNSLHHCSAPDSPTRDANHLAENERKSSLKLPPRLQNDSEVASRTNSFRVRNSSVLKRSLSYLSFRNKEFDVDPFMAALDHVRDEDRKKEKEDGIAHKRTRSLSAIRTSDSKWCSYNHEIAEVNHRDIVTMPLNPRRQRSKRIKELSLGSSGSVGGSGSSRNKVRPSCSGALKKFQEIWKARFKSRKDRDSQLRPSSSFVCMGFVHRFIFE